MSRGYTLVEVVVAMLLMSIMVSSVFSLALSARQAGGKSDRRMEASRATKQMTTVLSNYVADQKSLSQTDILGPNANNPANRWSINDSTVEPPIIETCTAGSCLPAGYALAPGSHTVTGILPSWFTGSPYNAKLKYYVGDEVIDDMPAPQINVWVDWTEP